ncbi:MAG: DUF5668 domain-containing protein [Candidatus Veblenbacteria bacterium]|nr:DUF5668 domain-containing protein [Candidatus Veblenbacteria bacterium]MDZ4230131.1 DUF5668 domain-containing protein [Candidatus Veblenbacteria bacterium]
MFWGTALVIIGLVALLKNLGLIPANTWDIVWPVLLIALGISFLARKRGSGHLPWCSCTDCGSKQGS